MTGVRSANLRGRLTAWVDLPADVLLNLPRVVMYGRQQLRVENHAGIEECQPQRVRVRTQAGVLQIDGHWLRLRSLDGQEVVVEGEIERTEWTEGGGP